MTDLLHGIDVSNWQGEIDWSQVKAAGIDFAYMKASEGASYRDPTFKANWPAAREAGIIRGAYHFARPSQNTGTEEANYFINYVLGQGKLEDGDFLVLDLEDPDFTGDADAYVLDFLDHVESSCGVRPLLYSGKWYLDSRGVDDPREAESGLIDAAYQSQAPAVPGPWPVMAMWQNSDHGIIPGIAGPIDTDVFFGTREQLLLYGKGSDVAKKKPPVAPVAPTNTTPTTPPAAPATHDDLLDVAVKDYTVPSGVFAGLTIPELIARGEHLIEVGCYLADVLANDRIGDQLRAISDLRTQEFGPR